LSLSEKLAEFILNTSYEGLSSDAVNKAKLCLLDFLGCVYGGYKERFGRLVLSLINELNGKREATVIATGDKVLSAYAALVNGTMGHALKFDDPPY